MADTQPRPARHGARPFILWAPPLPCADAVGSPGNLALPLLPPSSPRWSPPNLATPLPSSSPGTPLTHPSLTTSLLPGARGVQANSGLAHSYPFFHTTRDLSAPGVLSWDDPVPRGRWEILSQQEVHLASSGGARDAAQLRTPPNASRARGRKAGVYECDCIAARSFPLTSAPSPHSRPQAPSSPSLSTTGFRLQPVPPRRPDTCCSVGGLEDIRQ